MDSITLHEIVLLLITIIILVFDIESDNLLSSLST